MLRIDKAFTSLSAFLGLVEQMGSLGSVVIGLRKNLMVDARLGWEET